VKLYAVPTQVLVFLLPQMLFLLQMLCRSGSMCKEFVVSPLHDVHIPLKSQFKIEIWGKTVLQLLS